MRWYFYTPTDPADRMLSCQFSRLQREENSLSYSQLFFLIASTYQCFGLFFFFSNRIKLLKFAKSDFKWFTSILVYKKERHHVQVKCTANITFYPKGYKTRLSLLYRGSLANIVDSSFTQATSQCFILFMQQHFSMHKWITEPKYSTAFHSLCLTLVCQQLGPPLKFT